MRVFKFHGFMVAAAVFAAIATPNLFGEDPPLINIKDLAPGIRIDMRYASTNNFTGQQLYPVAECLLCEPAARRLAKVQTTLEKQGLGLKVWDCYRPISIQEKLWSVVPDPRYVADPKSGSRHNRGASVDLTLVNAKGEELPMPTAFDEFSEKAHRDYDKLPEKIKANRALLQTEMEKEGFIGLPTEWWHFDAPEWSSYALRNEPLGSPSLKTDALVPSAFQIPAETTQLIFVTSKGWDATTGTLQRFERNNATWEKVGAAWDVILGSKGMSPKKTEGDLTAPSGLFKVGQAYGYAAKAPAGTKWNYQPLSKGWVCVDDPASTNYNRVFLPDTNVKKDWNSAETMRRNDDLYKWVINVEQNPRRMSGAGSCIFLHVWRAPGGVTEGCTAMEEKNIVTLLKWLDPAKEPRLLQVPNAVFP